MNAIWSLILCCLPCFPELSLPGLNINGQHYKIERLLGEGGFSYVYLVTLSSNHDQQYALKKIRCPFGSNDDSYVLAMKEIRNYHRFSRTLTPYVIQLLRELVTEEPDGSKTIYILLPYFERSLQDIINEMVLSNNTMPESEILRIFIGICRGVKVMHSYKKIVGTLAAPMSTAENEEDALLPLHSDEEDAPAPLTSPNTTELSELCPYAHRDLKPANVMLGPEGIPVLVDLGLCGKARIKITNRQQALTLQDFALEHCTLPYRAPELLEVPNNCEITEATDIWSLGCLLYCCCFGFSPFEKLELEQGANLNIAIARGKYQVPLNHDYLPELIDIIKLCLQMEPTQRPKILQLLESALLLSRTA
ncbi:protein kinase [Kocuria palustris]|nr:protein kinase [Kocuria palustris]